MKSVAEFIFPGLQKLLSLCLQCLRERNLYDILFHREVYDLMLDSQPFIHSRSTSKSKPVEFLRKQLFKLIHSQTYHDVSQSTLRLGCSKEDFQGRAVIRKYLDALMANFKHG